MSTYNTCKKNNNNQKKNYIYEINKLISERKKLTKKIDQKYD